MNIYPVLFLVFNRPVETEIVFSAIRKARPLRLYVAADGARDGNESDQENIELVRNIATRVDWECEVKTLFRDTNKGCKLAIGEAISWFFEYESAGIILEDDCLPSKSFFRFCSEMLECYESDTRIMAVSGDNFQGQDGCDTLSYYFSKYPHCWGWATWRRAWQYYDASLSGWDVVSRDRFLGQLSDGNDNFLLYWNKIFNQCREGLIDTWDYPWTFSCWLHSGLTILPECNLVTNIGDGEYATHTVKGKTHGMRLEAKEIRFPLVHPLNVLRDFDADHYTDRHHFNIASGKVSNSNRTFIGFLRTLRNKLIS